MKANKSHNLVFTTFILLVVLLSSCKKDYQEIIDDDQERSVPRAVHSNLALYWNNWSDGEYSYARAVSDFGNIEGFSAIEEDRCYVIYNNLRVKMIKDTQDAISGVVAKINIADHTRYRITFDVRVGDTFDWSQKGGKMGFGFLIGQGYTGGGNAANGDGGSFRLTWGVTNGVPSFRPYAYHVDQAGTYGDNFGKRYPATAALQNNTWYTVELYARSNTYANNNGSISMKVNGYTVLSDGSFRWTTNHGQRYINNMAFATFRGGGDGSEVSTDGYVYYDNLKLEYIAD